MKRANSRLMAVDGFYHKILNPAIFAGHSALAKDRVKGSRRDDLRYRVNHDALERDESENSEQGIIDLGILGVRVRRQSRGGCEFLSTDDFERMIGHAAELAEIAQ